MLLQLHLTQPSNTTWNLHLFCGLSVVVLVSISFWNSQRQWLHFRGVYVCHGQRFVLYHFPVMVCRVLCGPFIRSQELQHPCVEQRPGCKGNSQLAQHRGDGCLGWDFLVLPKEATIVFCVIPPCWGNACQSSLMMLLLHYANCVFEGL